ncbi:MAG: RodZ domain-containing protein [Marmoricola sp.]
MTGTTGVEGGATAPTEPGAPDSWELHRDVRVPVVLGLAASATAIAWLGRAGSGGNWVDWLVCAVTALIGVSQLLALADVRTPLLAADEQGVRIRLAREWLGLPWSTLAQVVVEEREGPVRDGRLVLVPRHLPDVTEALLPSSRRAVAWQRRLHGAPLTVPLSVATRGTGDVATTLRRLAGGRAEVVLLRGRDRAALEATERHPAALTPSSTVPSSTVPSSSVLRATTPEPADAAPAAGAAGARPALARLLARLAGGRTAEQPASGGDRSDGPSVTPGSRAPAATVRTVTPVSAVREAHQVVRAEVVNPPRSRPATPALPDAAALPRIEHVEERTAGAVVLGEDQPAAVAEPVIGPQVREARLRARLDVEELSERTRIRPHVLEAIEVDDFGPCGGDFYARGHLRTLARYLGLDAEALVVGYDEHYSHAPVNARRVFEAELATGISGGMRATSGGPRWTLIAAAVLALVMIWGVARFLTDAPAPLGDPVVSDSAGLAANHQPITSPLTRTRPIAVKAVGGRAHVVVRDRTGVVLWRGTLDRGERRAMAGVAPFTITASDAATTRVQLGKHWVGPVGPTTGAGHRTVG